MIKPNRICIAAFISLSLLLSGCSNGSAPENNAKQPATTKEQTQAEKPQPTASPEPAKASPQPSNTPSAVDISKVKPNESGKIMVVMFHNFIEQYTSGDKDYTTTFDAFRQLLPELYDKGYRLISMNDYLNNNISVPAGYIPMIFTFDDGTAGQFNLVEENGKLVANKQSAVGIMEEFNKTHPDFGLKGTFYVNLGLKTFDGKGSVQERLKYLVDKGFEIGNHTMTHINLKETKSADVIQKEIGGNQKTLYELIPDYKITSLALPFGAPSADLKEYVVKGEYQGVKYENLALMEVGANPTVSPVSKKFNPLSTARVRSSGIKPVECDLAWWLKNLSRSEQYVSDGDPNTVSVPKDKEANVDKEKLKGKNLNLY